MQKYVIVQLLEPMEQGAEFTVGNWPLHVTIAANFRVDWKKNDALTKLQKLLGSRPQIITHADDDDYFGPKNHTHVTLLKMTPELQALHDDVVSLLKDAGAIFDEPHYQLDGFRAHATVQKTGRLQKGDVVTFDALTIIDMFPRGDIRGRKVLSTLPLKK